MLSWLHREELEAQRRKEEERQKYLAGETEQARRDLERLAMVRKRREEAQKKREEEAARGAWLRRAAIEAVDCGVVDADALDLTARLVRRRGEGAGRGAGQDRRRRGERRRVRQAAG